MNRLSYATITSRYGHIKDGKWADESKWMTNCIPPQAIKDCVINSNNNNKPLSKIYCNKDVLPFLQQALANIVAHNLQHELKTFDGGFNIRMVRGSADKASLHSWGLAVDFGSKDNPLGAVKTSFSSSLISCFTDAGWIWGGSFSRKDNMHFEISDIILAN